MKRWLLPALLLVALAATAQHEYDNWFFGDTCALTFKNGAPVAQQPNGPMLANDGTASISDSAGNLLFYTNGVRVFGRNHIQMPNGFGLQGGGAQSALIVPAPGFPGRYYVFTVRPYQDDEGLSYSIVEMSLNGGLGDVTDKNITLLPDADGKVAATRNAAGDGYWILTHKQPTNYYAFPLTNAGVGNGVLSYLGVPQPFPSQWYGNLKFSPNGRFVAHALYELSGVEIADFNNATGEVTNPFVFYTGIDESNVFGIEFSPSGKMLYVAYHASPLIDGFVYQLNMTAGSSTDILNSAQPVCSGSACGGYFAAMQTAPDGKIYIAQQNTNYLAVIHHPDSAGAACNLEHEAVELNGECKYGLPNRVAPDSVLPYTPFAAIAASSTFICSGTCVQFNNVSSHGQTAQWFFDGGTPDTSTAQNPAVCYNDTGTFAVSFMTTNAVGSDTLNLLQYIKVIPPPSPEILQDEDTLYVTTGAAFEWYLDSIPLWQNTAAIVMYDTGTYGIVVTDYTGCTGYDEIVVTHLGIESHNAEPPFSLYPNPAGETLTLKSFHRGVATVAVYNMLGQPVLNALVENKTTLDVSLLPQAVYTVVLRSSNGVAVKRLLVQR